MADGNVASNIVDLNGVGVAQGSGRSGVTSTPIGRPIAPVRWSTSAACCAKRPTTRTRSRRIKNTRVEVFDGRNRAVWQNEVKLSDFGSFHANFLLPPTAAPGNYRIVVRDDDNHSFAGTFTVHEYQLEPVKLAVEYRSQSVLPRRGNRRQNQPPSSTTARRWSGREIRYQLAGGRPYHRHDRRQGRSEIQAADARVPRNASAAAGA